MPKAKMFVLSLCNHHFLLPVLIKNFQLHYPSIIVQERILVPSNYLQLLQKLVLENLERRKAGTTSFGNQKQIFEIEVNVFKVLQLLRKS